MSKKQAPEKPGMGTGPKIIIGLLVVIGAFAVLSWIWNRLFLVGVIALLILVGYFAFRPKNDGN